MDRIVFDNELCEQPAVEACREERRLVLLDEVDPAAVGSATSTAPPGPTTSQIVHSTRRSVRRPLVG